MEKISHEPAAQTVIDSSVADGWPLPSEPSHGRRGPALARSIFMTQIDDGWVLPSEGPTLHVVAKVEEEVEDSRINLNTASQLDLQTLPAVGQRKARRIVSWREHNGGFQSVDDLTKVGGFGAKSVANLADRLTV